MGYHIQIARGLMCKSVEGKWMSWTPNVLTQYAPHETKSRPLSECTSYKQQRGLHNEKQNANHMKLMYKGQLSHRILYLKSVSLLTSAGLAASYSYVISQKGLSIALAGVGFAFIPFFLSPIAISWFFKRYITELYYDQNKKDFICYHYGWLIRKRSCTFKEENVKKSDFTSMLNTFTVNEKPFFLHDEDLRDVESVELYKKMIGISREM